MNSVAELFKRLSGDPWRVKHSFNEDLLQANALLHNTAATDDEMVECLELWCQHKQPCQFGKIAGNQRRIHFCVLGEELVSTWSDEEIAEKIAEEKQLWKQRATCDALCDPARATHSFVLVVASPRVALAAPDAHLRAFSERILQLTGWGANRRGGRDKNTISSDFLYLRNPHENGVFYGFRFNVDWFACAADRRWWHDHRFPGGIAFTANSTGHMIRFREWYDAKKQGEIWALKQAMLTIQNAQPTITTESVEPKEQGRVTWLLPLDSRGKPLVESVGCPLTEMPRALASKDWTRYEGFLHTDHAVREEFFLDREIAPTSKKSYLMDFTYLYDLGQPDFKDFSAGRSFSSEEVYSEIGRPENWTRRASAGSHARSEEQAAIVAAQLLACIRWGDQASSLFEE